MEDKEKKRKEIKNNEWREKKWIIAMTSKLTNLKACNVKYLK